VFLVERGDCLFVDKALAAEMHGANAIIVYNDGLHPENSLFSFSCGKSDEKVNIPALMLSHADGLILVETFKSGNSLVNISAFSSPQCSTCEDEGHYALYCAIGLWRLDSYMWEISVAFACVMVIVVLLLRWSRRRLTRLLANGEPGEMNTASTLTVEQVDNMDMVTFRADEELGEQASCCICLENFVDGESLVLLPCPGRHAFHPQCIKNWLLNHSTKCPLCKFDVTSKDAETSPKEDHGNEENVSIVLGPSPNLDEESNETPLLLNNQVE